MSLKAAIAGTVIGAAVAMTPPPEARPAEVPQAVQEDPGGFFSSWKAPRKKRAEVDSVIETAHAKAAAAGVPADKYHYRYDEALEAWAWTDKFEAPSRAALGDPDNPARGKARPGQLMRAISKLRSAFVLNGHVPIFCATIEEIAHALRIHIRQARTILAQGELAGVLTVIRRYGDQDHEHATAESPSAECRLNIVVIDLPQEAWEHYAATKQRRGARQTQQPTREPPKQRAPLKGQVPRPLDPSVDDATYVELALAFTAAHEAKYRQELEAQGEQYDPASAGTIARFHRAAVGVELRKFAHQAQERALAKGRSDLTIETIRANVIRGIVAAYLAQKRPRLIEKRFPLGMLWSLGGKDHQIRDLLVLGRGVLEKWSEALEPAWEMDTPQAGQDAPQSAEQAEEAPSAPENSSTAEDLGGDEAAAAGESAPANEAPVPERADSADDVRAAIAEARALWEKPDSSALRLAAKASLNEQAPALASTPHRRREPARASSFPATTAPEQPPVVSSARGPPRPR